MPRQDAAVRGSSLSGGFRFCQCILHGGLSLGASRDVIKLEILERRQCAAIERSDESGAAGVGDLGVNEAERLELLQPSSRQQQRTCRRRRRHEGGEALVAESNSRLLDETVGDVEAVSGAVGAALRPIGSSNIWARSEPGSGGGATAVGAADGAARVGGGTGVARSGGWTRPGTAVVVGAGGRHGAEAGAQA